MSVFALGKLTMAEVDWSNAAWDTIPAYRLSQQTVDPCKFKRAA
jgi:hypothetical protein